MNLILFFCIYWMGIAGPVDVSVPAGEVVIEETVDPVQRWEPLVADYFPPDEIGTALCIMDHESGGDPDAANPRSTASGLFQILGSLWAPHFDVRTEDLYEPVTNIRLASQIWDLQGWSAWSPYQRGACH
jgi:hypothetical protein